jgi:hypothetical protein
MKNQSFDSNLQTKKPRGPQQVQATPSATQDRLRAWKPQSCGLSPREIRQVVIDQIG